MGLMAQLYHKAVQNLISKQMYHSDSVCLLNRTKSCIFGNETCPNEEDELDDDVYGLQHQPFCNGPMTEVCPLAAGSDFGDFKQFDIAGESRSLRYI